MRPGNHKFIGPLTAAQQRRRLASKRRFDRYADIAYTWNITIREAMNKDTDERRGLGGEYRLSEYSTRQHLYD